MNRMTRVLVATLLTATHAIADEVAFPVRDAAVVQDGSGSARVLLRTELPQPDDHVLVSRAILTLPWEGGAETRIVDLRACPVTESWQGGGRWETPFDRELYSRGTMDLRRGSGTISFDVTVAVQGAREQGLAGHGFVLTAATEPQEVSGADIGRIRADQGVLRIWTTNLPSGPPPLAWQARQMR